MNSAELAKCGKIKNYSQNEYICMEGETGKQAYLLLSGTAEVVIKAFRDRADLSLATINLDAQRFFRPKAFTDKSNVIAELGYGSIIGEMSLLQGQPRSASVIVTSTTATVLVIDKHNFSKVIAASPDVGFTISKSLISRIENTLDKIEYDPSVRMAIHGNPVYAKIKEMTLDDLLKRLKADPFFLFRELEQLSNILTRINTEMAKKY